MRSVAPHSRRTGSPKNRKTHEYKIPAASPLQKEMPAICRAFSKSFLPSARAIALAPPTPKRLEMAVSIKNMGNATVMAAVAADWFSIPTK